MSAMSAKERDAALAAGALAFMLDDWVHERFELPAPDVLDLGREEPEAAARMLRQKWALGEKPVKNMLHLLEAKGVRVFSLVEETRTIDAFSLWRKRKPYVFLNTMKSAERSRFDAAHELGHLILHQHGAPQGREAEEHADRFASAFLMPPADVKAIMPRVHSLHQIVVGKKRWGVSVGALNRQLHRVGAATDWQYRTFAIQISEHGYRTTEPNGLPPEKSVIWQKVLAALWQERTTKNQIAEALSIPPFEIENLVFGLASMTTLDGGATTGGKSRADLRLVGKPDNA